MCESQLFGMSSEKVLNRVFLVVLSLSMVILYCWMTYRPQIQSISISQSVNKSDELQQERGNKHHFQCTPVSQSVQKSDPIQQERFWFDLVANKNTTILRQLPSQVLRTHACFWLTQNHIFGNESSQRKVESLSEILQIQMGQVLGNVDCSNRLTLNCGHQEMCGFGCQIQHRAFCVLVSFTLGIPLIHDTTFWHFKSSWGTMFQRLGSGCKRNNKTIYLTFGSEGLSLEFKTLCSENSCVTNRKVRLQLDEGVLISKELLDLVKAANHLDPFLWYMGQFIRYTLRYNEQTLRLLENYEKDFTFDASHPVVGRTDKIKEAKNSFHPIEEYAHIFKMYFQMLENHQDTKTVFVASDDHTVLRDIRKSYKLPSWKILGFDANITMAIQTERNSLQGLISIVRDVHFLIKSDFVVCGLSSNVCRLIIEIMATRFPKCESRVYSMDGAYTYLMSGLNLKLKLVPV